MDEFTPQNTGSVTSPSLPPVAPSLGSTPTPLAPPMLGPTLDSTPTVGAESGSKKKYLMFGGIGALALVLGVSAYFVFGGGEEASPDDEPLVVVEEEAAEEEESLVVEETNSEEPLVEEVAVATYCGDGICNEDETPYSCPIDCRTPAANPESTEEMIAVADTQEVTDTSAISEAPAVDGPVENENPEEAGLSEFEEYVASLQEVTTGEETATSEGSTELVTEEVAIAPSFACPEGTVYEPVLDACILSSDLEEVQPESEEATETVEPTETVVNESADEATDEPAVEPTEETAAEPAATETVTEQLDEVAETTEEPAPVSKTAAADAAELHGAYIQGDTGPAPIAYLAIYGAAQGLLALRRRFRK